MAKPAIETRSLTKTYGKYTALNSLSISVEKGEIFGLLGANGAGKSTTMKILTGLLRPTSGIALIGGLDASKNQRSIKSRIGYMSQRFSLYEDLLLRENIEFHAGIYGVSKAQLNRRLPALLKKLNLYQHQGKQIRQLDPGSKQMLSFAVSLVHEPEVLILDEPTGGVDPLARRLLWEYILEVSSHGTTVFVSTHLMEEAAYCNRIAIMQAGEMQICDTPSNLKGATNSALISEAYLKIVRGNNDILQ